MDGRRFGGFPNPHDHAEGGYAHRRRTVLAGPLSDDMTEIAGKMDNQLCADFRLKRVS